MKRTAIRRRTPLKAHSGLQSHKRHRQRPVDDPQMWSWAREVTNRAGHRCEICCRPNHHQPYDKLEGHHIIGRAHLKWKYDPDNGVCLCTECHRRAHDDKPAFLRWLLKHDPRRWKLAEDRRADYRRVTPRRTD